MCLILARDPEVNLPYDSIKQAVINNPHGWGYVIPDRGKLHIRRFFDNNGTDPDDVYDVLDEYLDKKIFLHLRFATAGERSSVNCHPFPALKQRKDGMQVWVMHNGTVNNYKIGNDRMSDTYHFTEKVISPLLKRIVTFTGKTKLLQDPFVGLTIEKFANNWSKWLLVDNYGNHITVGEGVQKEGYWVSNDYSFKVDHRKPATTTTGKSYYYGNPYGSSVYDAEYEDVTEEQKKDDAPFYQASSEDSCNMTEISEDKKIAVPPAKSEEAKKTEDPVPFDTYERLSFLEVCGIQSLDELASLTEEDLLDMVKEYPELMCVLIQDLLWERLQ